MNIKIKKIHPNAVIPSYSKPGDAGMDLTAISIKLDSTDYDSNYYIEYGTGLSIEIPEGYVGLIFPRSSISDVNMILTNSVGVVDSNYRGEIKLRFKKIKPHHPHLTYQVGERIGQLIIIPYPQITFKEVNELSETERGNDGFGSSGK